MSFEAADVSVIVGFSPVTPGNSMITSGITAGAGGSTTEGDAPLGFVDALLAMLAPSLGTGGNPHAQDGADGNLPDGGGAAGTPVEAPTPVAPAGLTDLGLAVDAEIQRTTKTAEVDDTGFGDRLEAVGEMLSFLEEIAREGGQISPKFEQRLVEMVEQMVGVLGIEIPASPTSQGEVAAMTEAADPAVDGKALPHDNAAQPIQTSAQLVSEFTAAVKQATAFTPVITEKAPEPAATTAPPVPAADETAAVAPPPPAVSPLGRLVARLTAIADTFATDAPQLSARLDAVASKLTSGTLDPDVMARFAGDFDGIDLDALLAPRPEAAKPAAPAPSLFTAPTLPTPEVVTLPPKQAAEPRKTAEAPAPVKEPEPAKPEDRPVAAESKVAERVEAEPKTRDRGTFAAHLAEARGDKPAAEVQQTPQPQMSTAPVKADAATAMAAPRGVHAAYQAPVQQLNMPQVAFEVVRQFSQGASRFQIRLDPPELGRIDVRMQVDGDGNVHARMTVERAETLDLMQRDQRSLEKALAQAGLDGSKTNLEFSLRQNPFGRDGQGQQHQQDGGNPFLRDRLAGADEASEIATTTTQYRGLASASGVNLFV